MAGLVALLCVGLAGLGAVEGPWRSDLAAALAESGGRPVALLFVGAQCPPCHRMIAESAEHAAVGQALQEVVGIVVDSTREAHLAGRLGIHATPTLVLVNRHGELVRSIPGYLRPEDLATSLRVLALHGDEQGQQALELRGVDLHVLAAGDDPAADLLPLLGIGPAQQRLDLRRTLTGVAGIAAQLWPLLVHESLGVRCDAAAVLAALHPTGAEDYDPFAAADERASAAERWRTRQEAQVVP